MTVWRKVGTRPDLIKLMFYVVVFSILAVVLVVGGIAGMQRRKRNMEEEERQTATQHPVRRDRKAKRTQSRHDRRKRR